MAEDGIDALVMHVPVGKRGEYIPTYMRVPEGATNVTASYTLHEMWTHWKKLWRGNHGGSYYAEEEPEGARLEDEVSCVERLKDKKHHVKKLFALLERWNVPVLTREYEEGKADTPLRLLGALKNMQGVRSAAYHLKRKQWQIVRANILDPRQLLENRHAVEEWLHQGHLMFRLGDDSTEMVLHYAGTRPVTADAVREDSEGIYQGKGWANRLKFYRQEARMNLMEDAGRQAFAGYIAERHTPFLRD